MNKVKKYFADYGATMKVCHQFNKEHWLGNIIFGAALVGTEMGIFCAISRKDDIKDWIHDKREARRMKKEMD